MGEFGTLDVAQISCVSLGFRDGDEDLDSDGSSLNDHSSDSPFTAIVPPRFAECEMIEDSDIEFV
jgi:hypothetical protein